MKKVSTQSLRQLAWVACVMLALPCASTATHAQPGVNQDVIQALKEIRALTGRTPDSKTAAAFDAQEKRIRGNVSKIRQQAGAELAKAGKDAKEVDKLFLERSRKVGVPAEVLGYVQAAGGPTRVITDIDAHVETFIREARADILQPRVSFSVDTVVAALFMTSQADALFGGFRRSLAKSSCSLVMWASGGTTDDNYATCMS